MNNTVGFFPNLELEKEKALLVKFILSRWRQMYHISFSDDIANTAFTIESIKAFAAKLDIDPLIVV